MMGMSNSSSSRTGWVDFYHHKYIPVVWVLPFMLNKMTNHFLMEQNSSDNLKFPNHFTQQSG